MGFVDGRVERIAVFRVIEKITNGQSDDYCGRWPVRLRGLSVGLQEDNNPKTPVY